MDLGATVCTRTNPACDLCPLAADCRAQALNRQTDFPGRKPKELRRMVEGFLNQLEQDDLAVRKP